MAQDMNGTKVKVGDSVEFKSDYEQVGEVVDINKETLTLFNDDGFGGSYLRYAKWAYEPSDRCSVIPKEEDEGE